MAVGTSAPELGVNITASIQDHGDIALGNILGSNISNLLLIFPIALLFSKKVVLSAGSILQSTISAAVSFIILLFALVSVDSSGSYISKAEGLLLILLVFVYWFYLYKITVADKEELLDNEPEAAHILDQVSSPALLNIITLVSLGVLLAGSHLTTANAVLIARSWGISELTIAGIIIAIGTSLPELVTSIQAVRQRHYDLMIGNIVGSNIINTLFILGTSALIRPMAVAQEAMAYLLMNCAASVLLLVGARYLLPGPLKRPMALIFIITYILFLIYLRSAY